MIFDAISTITRAMTSMLSTLVGRDIDGEDSRDAGARAKERAIGRRRGGAEAGACDESPVIRRLHAMKD